MSGAQRFLVFLFLLLNSGGFPVFAQTLTPSSSATPLYSCGPVTDYIPALPNLRDVLRFRRGERYNNPILTMPELGEVTETKLWELRETHFRKDPMPFGGSDAVASGTITAGQAYLSNDKQNIYSEFKLKIQETVKAPNNRMCEPGGIPSMLSARAERSGFHRVKCWSGGIWRIRCRGLERGICFF
jgi:hypothetical protein